MAPEALVLGQVGDEVDGRFVLQCCVGGGSQGWVWQALDSRQQTSVAVKLSPREAPASTGAVARAGRFVGPNTPHVLRRGVTAQGHTFAVFSWMPGTDLDALLAEGPLPQAAWLWVGCQIARALADLHALAVIHGDVRLRNVRVVHDGARAEKAALLDLDLSSDAGQVAAGQQTLHTRSPELADGQAASVASDLYALGCVLYWAATGQPPFDGDPGELRGLHRYAPRPTMPEAWPKPLRTLVTDLLAVDPAARPRSAAVVAELLAWQWTLATPEPLAGLALAPLLGRGGVPSPLETGSALTVGRGPELAMLDAALDALAVPDAEPQALLLTGPQGVGRSHLLRELGRRVVEHELRLVHGTHALEAAVLAETHAPGPLGTLDLEAGGHLAVRAARHVLRQWPTTPLVWLLDDAQELTPLLQAVVEAILEEAHTARRPLLLVAAWSDAVPQPPTWGRLAQTHAVGPLDDVAVQTWLRDIAGPDELPVAQVQACAGLPGLLAGLVLQAQVQRMRPSGLRRSTVPQPPLAVQLARLLAAAGRARGLLRTLLHAMALAERPLPAAVLAPLAGGRHEHFVALAVRAGAVVVTDDGIALASREWRAEVQRSFADDARRMHGELAQAWLTSGAPHAWAVGHLWRAGAAARAWHLARPAIERALAVPDFAQAEALLADAELYGETSGVLTLADWAWVLLQRATVLGHAMQPEDAAVRCKELRLLDLQVPPDSAEAQVTRWAWVAGAAAEGSKRNGAAMLALVDEGLARHEHVLPLRAELWLKRGLAHYWLADPTGARRDLDIAAAAFAEAQIAEGEVRVWAERAVLVAETADPEERARCVAALRPLASGPPREDVSPLVAARLRFALGLIYTYQGLWAEAETVLQDAEELLRAMGHRWGHQGILLSRAGMYRKQKRFAEAEPLLLQVLRQRESAQRPVAMSIILNNVADLYQSMGRPAEALPFARRAVAVAEGLNRESIFALCTLAETLADLGHSVEAEDAARRSLAFNGTPPSSAWIHACCVRLLAQLAGARGEHEAAAAWLQQLPDPPETPTAS